MNTRRSLLFKKDTKNLLAEKKVFHPPKRTTLGDLSNKVVNPIPYKSNVIKSRHV